MAYKSADATATALRPPCPSGALAPALLPRKPVHKYFSYRRQEPQGTLQCKQPGGTSGSVSVLARQTKCLRSAGCTSFKSWHYGKASQQAQVLTVLCEPGVLPKRALVLFRRALYTLIGEQGPGRRGEGGPTVQGGHRSLTEGWA